MDKYTADQIELSAMLDSFVYLDDRVQAGDDGKKLWMILDRLDKKYINEEKPPKEYLHFKQTLEKHPEWKNIELIDRSSTNSTDKWTDDLIQACTFKDADGNFYVAYRGTGDGRWPDNGEGMTVPSTEMQMAAADYFDSVAEKYMLDAHGNRKKIIVTGHSKGGNEAQYVTMASKYEYLIDNCYSFDGQGFSRSAMNEFKNKYGEDYYNKQVDKMYSICGNNDYVHNLGLQLIPEDKTYYIKSTGKGFKEWHDIMNMSEDENGKYVGLIWSTNDNDEIIQGKQEAIGNYARVLSEMMMRMDDEDLNGTAVAMMATIAFFMQGDRFYKIGNTDVTFGDFIDLFAHGVPTIALSLITTEEGREALGYLTKEAFIAVGKWGYEKFGIPGAIGAVIGTAVLAGIAVGVGAAAVAVAKTIEFVISVGEKIVEFGKAVADFFTKTKDLIISGIQKIGEWFRSFSSGYSYASNNPLIKADTAKLREYANRLADVNRRVSRLDSRMDSLYWQVGFLDLWNLICADLLTCHSWRLTRCIWYLNDTASEFESVENNLVNSV